MDQFSFQNSENLTITGKWLSFPLKESKTLKKAWDLLLIHAFPFDSTIYLPNMKSESLIKELNELALKIGRIRLFFPDLPGFGTSTPFKTKPINLAPYVKIIHEIIQKFEIENLILGGCSMGGYIALEYTRAYPSELAGMILMDTKTAADNEEQKANRRTTVKKIEESLKSYQRNNGNIKLQQLYDTDDAIKDFIDDLREKITSKKNTSSKQLLSEQILLMMKEQSPNGVIHALLAMAGRNDTTATLESFNKNVLIVVGSEDSITPIEIAQNMKKIASNASLKIIDSAGHLSNFENPTIFNQILFEWLKNSVSPKISARYL